MTKTEQKIIDLLAEGRHFSASGPRDLKAFRRIRTKLNSTGNYGSLVGFIIHTGAGYFKLIPLGQAIQMYSEHFTGGSGDRYIMRRK